MIPTASASRRLAAVAVLAVLLGATVVGVTGRFSGGDAAHATALRGSAATGGTPPGLLHILNRLLSPSPSARQSPSGSVTSSPPTSPSATAATPIATSSSTATPEPAPPSTPAVTSTAAPTSTAPPPTTAPTADRPCGVEGAAPAWRHVVWILMENKAYSEIVGSPSAPYLNALGRKCGVASNYTATGHPSLADYIALTSGSTQGITDDQGPSAHRLAVPSIFSQVNGSWRSLQESMSVDCQQNDGGEYVVRHNPAAYYTNIATQCANLDVPLGSTPDISATFTFITPNLCDDMHDCSVSTGDAWLSRFMPAIFATPQYREGDTAVFITWDEDDSSAGNHVATLVVSPSTPPGTVSGAACNHYSLLRTTEEMLHLSLLANAATASSMRSAFRLG